MTKPLIGIVCSINRDENYFKLNDSYRRAIILAGGNPIMLLFPQLINYSETRTKDIPKLTIEEEEMIVEQIKLCDAILLPGGFKMVDANFFILNYAIENDIPIMGICLGMQIMCNYKREPYNEKNESLGIKHYLEEEYVHDITIDEDSKLYSIIKKSKIRVNSYHNYHVIESNYYKSVAYSNDGIIEAIEYPDNTFNIGVQWHPEKLIDTDDVSQLLFKDFIKTALVYRKRLI